MVTVFAAWLVICKYEMSGVPVGSDMLRAQQHRHGSALVLFGALALAGRLHSSKVLLPLAAGVVRETGGERSVGVA